MGRYKEKPKYHVISLRVNDTEKSTLEAMTQQYKKSVSRLMREAIQLYVPQVNTGTVRK